MKNVYTNLLACAILLAPFSILNSNAQTITFDTDDYKAVSVYDSWTDSPLRDGTITPAVEVLDNHLTDADALTGLQPDTTAKIVGFQRSRYGSNLCGLRVDLNETFRLTKESRYVHILVNRPVSDSRLMLITLGKRSERSGQSTDVEQTWSLYSSSTRADSWFDAVFEIKGFSYEDTDSDGIDIYSLVICPDVTDRSDMDEDFVCYIDQIEVSSKSAARVSSTLYSLSFDESQEYTRTDRHLDGVGLTADGTTYSATTSSTYMYTDCTRSQAPFTVSAGQTVTPSVDYTGNWMGVFAYVDWGQDGQFSYDVNDDGTPADGSDLVSYNGGLANGSMHNSKGEALSNGNQVGNGYPDFTIPEDAEPGIYRMRYKVDWSSLDPAGNTAETNTIISNGGGIADVLLNVRATETLVTASQLNGDIVNADDESALNGIKVAAGESLRIKVVPASGFTYSDVRVTYGYNLSGDSVVNENLQHFTTLLPTSAFDQDELTLPDSIMAFGEVSLEGLMVQETLVELVDTTVTSPSLTEIKMNGTGIALAERTMTLEDNTHSLQDFTSSREVGLIQGNTFEASTEGTLYIDLNRDGRFSAATEQIAVDSTLSQTGIFRALWQTDDYQFLFLANLCPEKVTIQTDITDGRFVSRSKTVDGEVLYTTGVPTATDTYKFLGIIAQPMTSGFSLPTTATLRYGHNLDGDQTLQGIQQWTEEEVTIGSDGRVNVGYNNMYGTLRVEAACPAADDSTWKLAFSDEFDEEEIDDTKWTLRNRANAVWNRFISDNPNVTFIEDGSLVCRACKNVYDSSDDSEFLSGMRQSSNSYAMLYGYVEARVLTTPHTGNFPAFWMMPSDQSDGWPVCGEIDIWETIDTENRTYHTVHSNWTYNLGYKSNPTSSGNAAYTQAGEWHTYGLLKEEDKMTWYVDGTEVFSYAKSTTQSDLDQGQWPFDKAFYVILNQSVGNGSWASAYDASFVYETRFDWVRAYEPVEDTENGIENVSASATALSNNHLTYDLSGRPTTPRHPGVYIKDGRPIIIK